MSASDGAMTAAEPEWPAGGTPAVACAWCGARLNAGSRRRRGRTECEACGSATTDPVPSGAQLERAYGAWYRPASGRFAGPGDRILQRTRARLAARVDRIAPAGPVLDVGSGDGTLLRALRDRGRRAVGVERGGEASGELDSDLRKIEGPWAAIVFWHSLEHLPDAGEVVAHAARLLEPGGSLIVAVPNYSSWQARLFGDRWLALDLPRHLVHVPFEALADRLTACGLTVERRSATRGGQVVFGWLHGLVATAPSHPDLYDAIRRGEARSAGLNTKNRLAALALGALLLPLAALAAAAECLAGRSGTTYVEARRG